MRSNKIDVSALQEIMYLSPSGGDEVLRKVIATFLSTAKSKVASMARNYKNKNFEQLKMDVHILNSTSFRVGATELARRCSKLEWDLDHSLNLEPLASDMDSIKLDVLETIRDLELIIPTLNDCDNVNRSNKGQVDKTSP